MGDPDEISFTAILDRDSNQQVAIFGICVNVMAVLALNHPS
jgi:hypothetical protein